MSAINGSSGVVLSQHVQCEPEVISIPSDVLSELESSMENSRPFTLEGEEMEALQHQPTELNSESEDPIYREASSPPPSPSSDSTSKEPHSPRELCVVDSGDFVPPRALMVCSHCFVYVMVSTTNRKCPRCESYDLFDVLSLLPVRP